jgi:polyhydroxyalkanoate synthesis regulator phasin
MKKTKFDILFEKVVTVTEGRKKKVYPKFTLNVDKLTEDLKNLKSPFKNFYLQALQHVQATGNLPETKPEWESTINHGLLNQGLGPDERNLLFKRFWHVLNTPDHSYFVEFDENAANEEETSKSISSVEEHIYNYIIESDDESASKEEIKSYISKYGHEEEEVDKIIDKMVKEGQLGEQDGKLVALKDPSLDELEAPETLDTDSNDDMEAFRTDTETGDIDSMNTDSAITHELDDETAKDLGIDPSDPWGEKGLLDDNFNDYDNN